MAVGVVAYLAWRYDRLSKVRNYMIAAPVILLIVAGLSASSVTTDVPCDFDATKICSYNDSTPFMGVFVGGYVLVCAIKSAIIYGDR